MIVDGQSPMNSQYTTTANDKLSLALGYNFMIMILKYIIHNQYSTNMYQ